MINNHSRLWHYISHLFIAVDQFGNALAGGNSDNTISARVGYYNHHYYGKNKVPWYWSLFERIIDTAFYPVDGPGHCHEAYHNDPAEVFDHRLTNVMIAIAATIVIIPSCVFIAFFLYLLSALRIVKRKNIARDVNLEKRFTSGAKLLESTLQEIQEHGVAFELEAVKQRFEEVRAVADAIEHHLKDNSS